MNEEFISKILSLIRRSWRNYLHVLPQEGLFKTGLGVLLTLGFKNFLLVFLNTKCIKLPKFKNLQITKYTILDPRALNEELNLGKAY